MSTLPKKVYPKTQDEKREFLDKIMLAAQRCRSMAAEELGADKDPVMMSILEDLLPFSFPGKGNRLGIVESVAIMRTPGREISNLNIYNILFMVNGDANIQWWMATNYPEVYIPEPMEYMMQVGI